MDDKSSATQAIDKQPPQYTKNTFFLNLNGDRL